VTFGNLAPADTSGAPQPPALLSLSTCFSDAQCRFKAIRREAAAHLLLLVEDNG